MICAWMAKSTVVYSIPTEEKYPVFGYVFHAFRTKNFNPDNLFSMIFGMNPQFSIYCWVVIFIGSIIWLNLLYKKITSVDTISDNDIK